jgi:hypothetical protein
VKTYSPYLNEYKIDPVNDFIINYDMAAVAIEVFSNFAVSQLIVNRSSKQVSFELSSERNETGYCNVTVPKSLFSGNSWMLTINDEKWGYSSSENTTHASIHFECNCSSLAQVIIKETNATPDYSIYVLFLIIVIGLLGVILFRKKLLQD